MLLDLEDCVKWVPHLPTRTKSRRIDGCSPLLRMLRLTPPSSQDGYQPTQTKFQLQAQHRKQTQSRQTKTFKDQLDSYSPQNDHNIQGDANATLFLARLPYSLSESEIRNHMAHFGKILSMRLLKGYAFILFESPTCVSRALQQTNGSMLLGGSHRVILDWERARLQPAWKPRRLGGGLGGRFSLQRQRSEAARSQQIARKGPESISPRRPLRTDTKQEPRHQVSQTLNRGGYNRPYERPNWKHNSYKDTRRDSRVTSNESRLNTSDSPTEPRMGSRVDSRSDPRSNGRILRQY